MNINDHVKVVLTEYGAETYNKWALQFPLDFRPARKDEGDTLKDSLWHIMQVFGGEKIFLGMLECPFYKCQMEIC